MFISVFVSVFVGVFWLCVLRLSALLHLALPHLQHPHRSVHLSVFVSVFVSCESGFCGHCLCILLRLTLPTVIVPWLCGCLSVYLSVELSVCSSAWPGFVAVSVFVDGIVSVLVNVAWLCGCQCVC